MADEELKKTRAELDIMVKRNKELVEKYNSACDEIEKQRSKRENALAEMETLKQQRAAELAGATSAKSNQSDQKDDDQVSNSSRSSCHSGDEEMSEMKQVLVKMAVLLEKQKDNNTSVEDDLICRMAEC
ncbi:hypothetical protein QAD02_013770 [Eretmocerus hayati]|uniref:Uncharacterized protein n=1 Tax=Eretmocerus hayati TaxID=131215 RepID=A0ACC2P4D7_9HYME|nr:hypothetical protein QAD02_013770 [Eretmocerus hayati]